MAAEVRVFKAELAKARADAAAAVSLVAEREPSGLGGTIDRLCSSEYSFVVYADCYKWEEGRILNINVIFFLVGAAVHVMTGRPGTSLANPNKAVRRVTAVEFVSDSDGA